MRVDPTVPQTAISLGPALRALREARQVELAQVSVRLKFSVRQLQALEDEDWVRLPSGLALRGMVKNYGRFLETDPAALLAMLDAQTGARTAELMHVVTPTSLGEGVPLHGRQGGRSWVWMALIAGILLVIVVYAFERGWIPESWLVFDWLRALAS